MLSGVDDGPRTLADAIRMLHIARENRIRGIILTPHYRKGMFSYPHDRIEAGYAALEKEAKRLSIRLYPGCEYYADHDMADNFRSGYCMPLAGSHYILMEFSEECSEMDLRGHIGTMQAAGYKPVIAHAERYEIIRRHPEILTDIRRSGVMVQLNAGNILGEEGRQIRAACARILRDENADIIASDAHNTTNRRNRMLECCRFIKKKYGKDVAKKLMRTNPECIIKNA